MPGPAMVPTCGGRTSAVSCSAWGLRCSRARRSPGACAADGGSVAGPTVQMGEAAQQSARDRGGGHVTEDARGVGTFAMQVVALAPDVGAHHLGVELGMKLDADRIRPVAQPLVRVACRAGQDL